MQNLVEIIKQKAKEIKDETILRRRHIHANPELSFEEYETAKYIEHKLNEIGITNFQRMSNTGVIALIEGKNPSKKVTALRADIDALPILEANKLDYTSKNKHGVNRIFTKIVIGIFFKTNFIIYHK